MTNTPLTLPALDGRDPLGFLAALGVLRLTAEHLHAPVRLAFDPVTAQAILHSPYTSTRQLADDLATVVSTIPLNGVLPDVAESFPLIKSGVKGSDPMRAAQHSYPQLVADTAAISPAALTWLAAICTDLGHDDKGRIALTPYTAPVGQQTVRSFFDKSLAHVRAHPDHLHDALVAWRRIDGFTGEYLDHRVLRSAADLPDGESSEVGVPGATWLAIMALPMLRLTGDGTTATATLWRRLPRNRHIMIWPLWTQPLDRAAAVTLIEHPSITIAVNDGQLTTPATAWKALGIFTVAAAQRQPIPERKSAGILTPTTITPTT